MKKKIKVFNLKKYTHDQLVDMLLCPVNRDMTRREHSCDDYGLWKNPEWLVRHYIEFGGAKEWAKRREEYYEEKEVDEEETAEVREEDSQTDMLFPRGPVW